MLTKVSNHATWSCLVNWLKQPSRLVLLTLDVFVVLVDWQHVVVDGGEVQSSILVQSWLVLSDVDGFLHFSVIFILLIIQNSGLMTSRWHVLSEMSVQRQQISLIYDIHPSICSLVFLSHTNVVFITCATLNFIYYSHTFGGVWLIFGMDDSWKESVGGFMVYTDIMLFEGELQMFW